jgi:hypothetical protein
MPVRPGKQFSFSFGTFLAFQQWQYETGEKSMDIILAICVTGLGVFGGLYFIWKGHYSSFSKAHHSSRTSQSDSQTGGCMTIE